MTDEIALWKRRIKNQEETGQAGVSWCEEHNITKGAYSYWRRQVMQAEGLLSKGTTTTTPPMEPLVGSGAYGLCRHHLHPRASGNV